MAVSYPPVSINQCMSAKKHK